MKQIYPVSFCLATTVTSNKDTHEAQYNLKRPAIVIRFLSLRLPICASNIFFECCCI